MRVPGIPYVQGRNSYADADGLHYGIAIHATANTASAENEAGYATRRTDGVSSHFYADVDSVIQSLDTTAKAGHAGSGTGNENALSVEITGLNSWSRAMWLNSVAWDLLGGALAKVIRGDPDFAGFQVRHASVAEMQSNPRVKAFYSHDDMRRAWGGTDHTDPGPNFPWDRLLSAVSGALSEEDNMDEFVAEYRPGGTTDTTRMSWYHSNSIIRRVIAGWDYRVYLRDTRHLPTRVYTSIDALDNWAGPLVGAGLSPADMAAIRQAAADAAESAIEENLDEIEQAAREGAAAGSGDLSAESLAAVEQAAFEAAQRAEDA